MITSQVSALRQSILKTAFSGELVPQDPNNKPAVDPPKEVAAKRNSQGEKPLNRRGGRRKGMT